MQTKNSNLNVTHVASHTVLWGEISVSLFDLFTNNSPVHNIRSCWHIIYMFVCSPTSCLGVVNVDIDQNHQLWWSPPGSAITEVWACQLNPGQREEANVCLNIAASYQEGLGSRLTPGLTALPNHIFRDRPEEILTSEKVDEFLCWRPFQTYFYQVIWHEEVKQHLDRMRERRGVTSVLLLLPTESWGPRRLDWL